MQNKTCFQIFVMSSIQVSHAVGRHLFLLCLFLTHVHPPNVFTEPSFIQLLTFLLLHNTPLNSMVRFLSRLHVQKNHRLYLDFRIVMSFDGNAAHLYTLSDFIYLYYLLFLKTEITMVVHFNLTSINLIKCNEQI